VSYFRLLVFFWSAYRGGWGQIPRVNNMSLCLLKQHFIYNISSQLTFLVHSQPSQLANNFLSSQPTFSIRSQHSQFAANLLSLQPIFSVCSQPSQFATNLLSLQPTLSVHSQSSQFAANQYRPSLLHAPRGGGGGPPGLIGKKEAWTYICSLLYTTHWAPGSVIFMKFDIVNVVEEPVTNWAG
jgi:hypothetical protein